MPIKKSYSTGKKAKTENEAKELTDLAPMRVLSKPVFKLFQ